MKAILFSDVHIGLKNSSPEFHKIVLDFAKWMAKEANDRNIKTLIFGGDLFHNRKYVMLPSIQVAYEFFDILKDFEIHMITGNHDCFYLENSTINSLHLFKGWSNLHIYDSPKYINFGSTKVGFIPWGIKPDEMEKCDVMFGHYDIVGYQMGTHSFCEHGIDPKFLLKKSPLIFSGHFHKPQSNSYKEGKIIYMGSPYQHDWGDAGQSKYIYEFDFDTKQYLSIENTISPKHIEITKKEDLKMSTGNIIRIVSDSPDSELMKEASKLNDAVSLDVIVETKDIEKLKEIISDFKGVDIMDGIKEVVSKLEGVSKDMQKKIISKCKDYYEKS